MLLPRRCHRLCSPQRRNVELRQAIQNRLLKTTTTIHHIYQTPACNNKDDKQQLLHTVEHVENNIQVYDHLQQLLGLDALEGALAAEERQYREDFARYPYSSRIKPEAYGYDPLDGPPAVFARQRLNYATNWRDEPSNLTLTAEKVRKVRGIHDIRIMLRRSFQECISVRDILMLTALCMQRDNVIRELLKLPHLMYTALYRARDHSSDRRIAGLILTVIRRTEQRGCLIEDWLLQLCVKFAARSRNLNIMHRALREFKQRQTKMSCHLFRSVVAKFSIGRKGYGEVRNGRWKRSDLLQVLFGFNDPRPGPPCHLATFLQREDWQFLHGWVMLLARCRAYEELEFEWHLWLQSPMRKIGRVKSRVETDQVRQFLFQSRGDNWMIRHMLIAGDAQRGWTMIKDLEIENRDGDLSTQFSFLHLPIMIRNVLLDSLEYATSWNEEIRQDLVRKYEADLTTIETRLGIRWVSDGNEGGWHEPEEDLPIILEELSRPDYFRVYGYITDSHVDESEA